MSSVPADKYQIDMCQGPLFRKIILFSMPLFFTMILQLLFNAVDLVVIGRYSTHESMAGIGATMNMNSLILNMFLGLSVGTNVVAARYFGAHDHEKLQKTVHTSIAISIYGGIGLMIFALLAAKPLLLLMQTPENILPYSCTYIWICFSAIPLIMVYNFGCAVLRAIGDTRRPFYFLIIAGTVNILLNLVFVIYFHMDVGGVALATAISHTISAALILRVLLKNRSMIRFEFSRMKIDPAVLKDILRIGVPAGISSSLFAVSNMLIQSSINSFGAYAMAGTTAAICIEGIVYVGSYSFTQTAVSFVAQNLGGLQFKRIKISLLECFACAVVMNLILGIGFYIFGTESLSLFNPEPEVVRWGVIRMKVMFTTYFLCGFMDVACGGLRGLGYSMISTVFSLLGACLFRIAWVVFVFPLCPTMEVLLMSYPISWGLVAIMATVALVHIFRKITSSGCTKHVEWSRNGWGLLRGLRFIARSK